MSSSSSSSFLIADAVGTPIDLKTATVLITGGSSGLGLALATRFLKAGSTVIVTGRRQNLLDDAKKANPSLHTIVSDAGSAADRENLFKHVTTNFPNVNVLINNAGIQRREALATDTAPWSERASEIEINLNGPIHLSTLFAPYFTALNKPAIISTVTSGLAFVPFVAGPVYSATKAGLHSFTIALRWSLAKSQVQVVEIIPPAVKSNLGGSHSFGEDQDEWADSTFSRFTSGSLEIGYKASDTWRKQSRQEADQAFQQVTSFFGSTAKQF